MLEKQDKNIELEMARVAVKNRKHDFMTLTADTSSLVKAEHMFFRQAILKDMGIRRAPSASMSASIDLSFLQCGVL
jgi:hypothetical protein